MLLRSVPDTPDPQARGERAWAGVRGSVGARAGRVYFEMAPRDDGLVRVGWASAAASRELGTDAHGFGFGGTGRKSHANEFTEYGRKFGKGDVVGCCLDADAHEVSFCLNGAALGAAYALPQHLKGCALFPALALKNSECSVNFGGQAFAFPPPPGFQGLSELPASSLVTPASAAAKAATSARRTPRAIVLEPARDLAEQTAAAFTALGAHLAAPSLTSALCVGGIDAGPANRALRDGCDIVTGTPARILDLVTTGKLELNSARFLILDEADRLLETGSADAIMTLFRKFPRSVASEATKRMQVLLFSATLHAPSVRAFADVLCTRPTWVDLKGKDFVPETVHHVVLRVDPATESWQGLSPLAPVDNAHATDAKEAPGGSLSQDAASAAVKRLKPHLLLRLMDTLKMEQVR